MPFSNPHLIPTHPFFSFLHECTIHGTQLAAPDEIVFTYVANTPGVVYPLFEDGAAVMYVPRFVRLKLRQLEGEGGGKGGGDGGKRGLRMQEQVRAEEEEGWLGEAVQEGGGEGEGGDHHRSLRRKRRWRMRARGNSNVGAGQQMEVRKPQQGKRRSLRTRRRKRARKHGGH